MPARRSLGVVSRIVRRPVPRAAALVVRVPEADRAVGDIRRRLDPAAQQGLPAHVTIMFPFMAPEGVAPRHLRRIAALASRSAPFDFVLLGTGWFDRRVLYLAPEPSAPFIGLVDEVRHAFPSCQPYGGAFPSVIPHVTVGEDAPLPDLVRADAEVRRRLPIPCRCDRLSLLVANGQWAEEGTFPLGPDLRLV